MGKRRLILFVFMLLFGLYPLLNCLGNPRLEALRGSDFMQLMGSAACFGFGFGVLFGGRKSLDR